MAELIYEAVAVRFYVVNGSVDFYTLARTPFSCLGAFSETMFKTLGYLIVLRNA